LSYFTNYSKIEKDTLYQSSQNVDKQYGSTREIMAICPVQKNITLKIMWIKCYFKPWKVPSFSQFYSIKKRINWQDHKNCRI